jgi:hypothetical protein
MTDEPQWLPPQAPGAAPPPRFQADQPQQRPEEQNLWAGSSEWTPPRAPDPPSSPQPPQAWAPPQERPVFVQPKPGSSNPMAIAALVLGIFGLVLLVFSLGLGFFIAVVFSGAAWIFGVNAQKRISSGEAKGGEGQAKAGKILGIVGVVAAVIAMVVWIILIANGFDIDEWRRDLERDLEQRRDGSNGRLSTWRAGLGALFQRP